ncbi:hypothetical protein HUT16_29880 [Kitasatospora sp. NA04385]|uniref:hypothetical protein n=1 Tax=Kitasatospora sp. NA04385 TaxID=2742135 RepID=UPI0015913535|nr:hypothetical protein [Kitasatospora sp. NA04385]QKW22741.1 hypothetical protein HUT16_29880 [Kitasatospora sp. NA04385]
MSTVSVRRGAARPAAARAEGGGRWYARLAARYLLAVALFSLALAALVTALGPHAPADALRRCLAVPAFCSVFLLFLLPAVPLRFSSHLARWVGVALVLPLLPLLLLFGPFPLPLVALHLAFARWFVPRPVFRVR